MIAAFCTATSATVSVLEELARNEAMLCYVMLMKLSTVLLSGKDFMSCSVRLTLQVIHLRFYLYPSPEK